MPIAGQGIRDTNPRLRFLIIVFLCTITFGVLLFWKDKYIYSQEFVDVPPASHIAKEKLKSSITNQTEETRKELQK